MAEKYGFFDAVVTNGVADRIYSADDVNELFKGLLSDGIFRLFENALKVTPNGDDMTVNVDTGKAIIKDHWYLNTTVKNLPIAQAHATLGRYSSVVLRYNRGNRSITLAVIDGDPASTPTIPALTQNNDVYEIRLANILVGGGIVSISNANITDTRSYTGGIVDAPALQYRRYSYTVSSSSGERYIDIPDSYNLTANTYLQVFSGGELVGRSNYTLQINEVEGNYMVVFTSAMPQNRFLEFIMIN